MKIILEFNEEEIKRADQSFHGPDYAMAAEDFRNTLRGVIKHGDHDDKTHQLLLDIQGEFYTCFAGLLDD